MNEGQRIAALGVGISAALAALKIFLGVSSGSSALFADGLESAGDLLASTFVLVGLTYAAKPADTEHPYGHGRAETLSGLIVGLLLFVGGLGVGFEALYSAPARHAPASYAVWPLVLSLVIKTWMVRLKYIAGKRIGSSGLLADAFNDAVDMLSAIVALAALGLTLSDPVHYLSADHYGAAGVGLIMVLTGIRVARTTGNDLMDAMPESGLVTSIRAAALEIPGVEGVEKIFARKTGLRHHVDLHLEVNPGMTVRASHELGHEVQSHIVARLESIAEVLVHIEPARRPAALSSSVPRENSVLPRLPEIAYTLAELTVLPEPFGDVRIYFEGSTDLLSSVTAGRIVLHPGASPHLPHRHPEEEFLLITEGTGEILINGKVKQVGAGSQMYCAADKLHGISNTGAAPMTFYFYKWLA